MTFIKRTVKPKTKLFLCIGAAVLCILLILFNTSSFGISFWKNLSSGLSLGNLPDKAENYEINVHFLSTGKSDCIIIQQGDTHILVDGGTAYTADLVKAYIKKCGIQRFDAVIASHPDNDHIGGLTWILNETPAEIVYTSNYEGFKSQDIDDLYACVKSYGGDIEQLTAGDNLSLGGLKLEIIGPIDLYNSTNDRSLVVKCTYKDFSMLLTGDMADHELQTILSSDADLSANILKAPHHGSRTGINKEFLRRVNPDYAVLTVGKNKSGLPDEITLELLREENIEIYNTQTLGNILISSNGDGAYTINQSGKIYY